MKARRHLQHEAESSKSSADQDDGTLESRRTVTSSLSSRRSSGSTRGAGGSSILSGASIHRGSGSDLLSGGRGGDGLGRGGVGRASVVGNVLGGALTLDVLLAVGLAEGVVWVSLDALGEGGLADVEWDGVLVLGKVLWRLAVVALAVPSEVSLGGC